MIAKKEIPFKKWTFVDKQNLDTEHWYIRLDGGKYHNVIFRFMKISLNMVFFIDFGVFSSDV